MRKHIVRSFEEELRRVTESIARMGILAEEQLESVSRLLEHRDPALTDRTVSRDREIDALDLDVAQTATRLLALRQPMAVDLRETLSAIKISADLERIGDLIKNIAKRATVVHAEPRVRAPRALGEMERLVRRQLQEVVGAYLERDAERAHRVWLRDEELDDWYESLFRELLTYMMEDPRTITGHAHLLFIAKNLERIGDHCANVAAQVQFLVQGKPFDEARPKGADARTAVVAPPGEEDA